MVRIQHVYKRFSITFEAKFMKTTATLLELGNKNFKGMRSLCNRVMY